VSKHWKAALIVAALAVIAWGAVGTYAWFSDTATLEGKTFVTGTVKIRLEPVDPPWHWWRWRRPRGDGPMRCAEIRNLKPGDTITFRVRVRSVGTLPLDYTIEPSLEGPLSQGNNPCEITEIRVRKAGEPQAHVFTVTGPNWSDTSFPLSAQGGNHPADLVEIDITMPIEAGSDYEGRTGHLVATFSATQQE